MKRLMLFCGFAGLLLGSAAPATRDPGDSCALLVVGCPDQRFADLEADPRLPLIVPEAPPVLTGANASPPAGVPATPPPVAAAGPEAAAPPPPAPPAVKILVSLPQQKAYVFRHGTLVTTSRVSTGRKGYETPVGKFAILQKKVFHRSSTYDDAPMPYMQRLTWSGVALHAGHVPGRPASHGCIRLPRSFAKKLYGMTNYRTTVTVTRARPSSAAAALKLI